MRTYEFNGKLYKFAEDKVPEGAVLHTREKAPVKAEPVKADDSDKKVESKAKKAPANKSRKAGSNK